MRLLILLVAAALLAGTLAAESAPAPAAAPLVLAHYMPWFEAKPTNAQWGWHWTMNHFNPDQQHDGRREAATHYMPLIGLYDSSNADVLECQALQMKLAGIDGAIIDWYGPDDYLDYGLCHRNSLLLIAALKKAGLKFAVCYEDQTVPRLVAGKVVEAGREVEHGRKVMRWLAEHWFNDPAYVKRDGKPLFLVFGPQFYKEEQWKELFAPLPQSPAFFTLHHRRGPALGAFDWPQPGPNLGLAAVDTFYEHAREWPALIPAAFPRFHDIYKEAGVGNSYGNIPDAEGKTYGTTLARALQSQAAVVQLATWNDWGEGTAIEPSEEFGYRDLEKTQALRREHGTPLPYAPADLRLPVELLKLRRAHHGEAAVQAKLDEAARLLEAGKPAEARRMLAPTHD